MGDDIENYNSILKTEKEIDEEIAEIKFLFGYDTENAENFTKQIIQISDKSELIKIVNSLKNIKNFIIT